MALCKSCPYTKYLGCPWVRSTYAELVYMKNWTIILKFYQDLFFPYFSQLISTFLAK